VEQKKLWWFGCEARSGGSLRRAGKIKNCATPPRAKERHNQSQQISAVVGGVENNNESAPQTKKKTFSSSRYVHGQTGTTTKQNNER